MAREDYHMNNSSVNAVILAGGKNSAEMEKATGVKNRALTRIAGKTMLEYVAEALHDANSVRRIVVVGDVPESTRYEQVERNGTLLENLLAGLDAAADGAGSVLVATSDIPFLTDKSVDDFVRRALQRDADLCYPIVSMDDYNKRFPQMKRTTLRLREGTFTGGNIMLLNPGFVREQRALVERAYAARKNVFAIGGMLGPVLLARIVLSQAIYGGLLNIPTLERAVGKLLGGQCRAAAVITSYAEIGTDVDKVDDVRVAEEILSVRGGFLSTDVAEEHR
jgi:GTP:adenosylcobinamide-phosphate guanylyltransferase